MLPNVKYVVTASDAMVGDTDEADGSSFRPLRVVPPLARHHVRLLVEHATACLLYQRQQTPSYA